MTPVALATSTEAISLDDDLAPLIAACAEVGLAATPMCWDDQSAKWDEFAAVVVRSTWDYVARLPAFLLWADHVSRHTRLLNSREVVRWNTDKRYLRQLASAGVPVVPTHFVDPGDDTRAALDAFLAGQVEIGKAGNFDEFVAKPAVGAGSKDALRLGRGEAERARRHVERLLAEGRAVLLQPYLAAVDLHGETAAIYLDGRYSHAIRKGPLLRAGADLVSGLFAAEDIQPREPDRDEGRVAKLAFNAIPFETPLYARIDLLRGPDAQPVVLELELVEPSLFFPYADGSAARFARALADRLA